MRGRALVRGVAHNGSPDPSTLTRSPPMRTAVPPSEAVASTVATEERTVAILSYVTLVGFIAAIVMQQSRRTQLGAFHLRQMLGLVLTSAAGALVGFVPILGWIAWLVVLIGVFAAWAVGLLSALKGDMQPVPIVGAHYQRWFAGTFA